MRRSLNDGERAIQQEVRSFLDRALPELDPIPSEFVARVDYLRAWQRQLHEAGLVGLSWPVEYGGRGATLTEQLVANQEMARAGAPALIGNVGLDVVGPSLVAHGTEQQKARFLDGILSARDIWCQGFSETGAGSDLASLKTKAMPDGDGFRIRGHKVWTSYAQHAQWCAVLARTDPDAPSHKGISYLLVEMTSPGIEARPLIQVTGDPEFGEVYFDDVFVPTENLLGPLHGGWRIAMHTLAHERGWYGLGRQVILRVLFDRLLSDARRIPRDRAAAIDDPALRSALARAHIGLEVLKHQGYRSVGKMLADGHPGPESSVDKVVLARVEQALADTALDVLGPAAVCARPPAEDVDPLLWQHVYLYGRAASVYGGSVQIQRNIIAERILGLPRSA
jgi:alkylation response protein AidB-like acyl-CoA dehydrogenase